ncbi:MAG: phycobiliprotein lyase, partial [Cyanobacteria bacterium P01_A01_bin.114]
MEIVNFFEKLAGKWFSQRTTHNLVSQQSQAGKSDLEVEFLESADTDIAKLCQSFAIDPGSALCGLKVTQKSTIEGNPKQQLGSALIVPLSPEHSSSEGTAEGTLLNRTPRQSTF